MARSAVELDGSALPSDGAVGDDGDAVGDPGRRLGRSASRPGRAVVAIRDHLAFYPGKVDAIEIEPA